MQVPPNLVLLSGGMDSAVTLARTLLYGPQPVGAVGFSYGQKHTRELEYAQAIADHYNVPFDVLDLPTFLFATNASALVGDRDIPNVDYSELTGVSPTYVPFRNGTFSSIVSSYVMAHNPGEICTVTIGVHVDDAAGDAYPDCSDKFISKLSQAISIGTYGSVFLNAPFVNTTKAQIVRIGHDLKVPFELTWSCYKGAEIHCGICPTCRARISAFDAAEVSDPTIYASQMQPELGL